MINKSLKKLFLMSLANQDFNTNIIISEEKIKKIINDILNGNENIANQINYLINNFNNHIVKQLLIENSENLASKIISTKQTYNTIYLYAKTLYNHIDVNQYTQMVINAKYDIDEIMGIIRLLEPNINLFLEYFINIINEHTVNEIPYIFEEICKFPNINQALLEKTILATNNIILVSRYCSIYKNKIIDMKSMQNYFLQNYNGSNYDDKQSLISLIAYECKNGAELMPFIDILIKNHDENLINYLLDSIVVYDNRKYITNEIIGNILLYTTDVVVEKLLLDKFTTAEYIAKYIVDNNINNENMVISIIKHIKDFSFINKFIINNKSAYLARTLLSLAISDKEIINNQEFNLILYQNILEKHGTAEDLKKILTIYLPHLQLNFALLKKKFNLLKEKEYSKDPQWLDIDLENIKTDISSMIHPKIIDLFYIDANKPIIDNLKLNYENKLSKTNKQTKQEDIFTLKNFLNRDNEKEINELIEYLIAKKDWFSIQKYSLYKFLKNVYIGLYKLVKNRTWIDMYHEVYKTNYSLVMTSNSLYKYSYEFNSLLIEDNYGILKQCIEKSTNFAEFSKYMSKLVEAAEIIHNEGIHSEVLLFAVANKTFNLGNSSNIEFLSLIDNNINAFKMLLTNQHYSFDNEMQKQITTLSDKISSINNSSNKEIINLEQFKSDFNIVNNLIKLFYSNQPIQWKTGTNEYNALKRMYTNIDILNNFETITKYLKDAKPKNEKLKNFNLSINGFDFKVLDYLDPKAFTIGSDTDCCQRVGGAGEEAAIDSFINPLASVLICYKDDTIISQSYFHYVPSDNGLILDNVEWNEYNAKKLNINNISLSKIYADYAAGIKSKYPDINYIKCGMEWNKIDNGSFAKSKMKEDPRTFDVEEHYSDFNENEHLDLLKPSESIKKLIVVAHNNYELTKQYIIKHSMVRTMMLKTLISIT